MSSSTPRHHSPPTTPAEAGCRSTLPANSFVRDLSLPPLTFASRLRKKVFQTALITIATFWAGIASAVLSGANAEIAAQFHVSPVVAELANGMVVRSPTSPPPTATFH